MKIFLHKNFIKKYAKIRPNEKDRFKERRNLFLEDPYSPLLSNHALTGKYTSCRSINITGDLRVVYIILDEDSVLFIDIDSHSNLYK